MDPPPPAYQASDMAPTPELLTIREAMHRLAVSRQTIYRLIRQGELRLVTIGKAPRIDARSVARLIEQGGADIRAD